jgi:hypothetical protein
MNNKKATFHITAESIVVLILAIVFLGLALTFLTVVYLGMEEGTEHAFDELTKQRIEQLRATDKQFDLEVYSTDLKAGEKKILFMILKSANGEEEWDLSHKVEAIGFEVDCGNLKLNYKDNFDMTSNDDIIPPFILIAENNANKGTCLYELTAENDQGIIETIELTVNIK